jgi:hypothetical protein
MCFSLRRDMLLSWGVPKVSELFCDGPITKGFVAKKNYENNTLQPINLDPTTLPSGSFLLLNNLQNSKKQFSKI